MFPFVRHRRLARTAGRVASIAVAASIALLAAIATPAPVHASDDLHNIPGVSLTAPTASGQLGGPIYDVVYRVLVPAGHVLIVSMTGSPGTDFDLYLFDSGATDIYADPPVGLVAQSTGPTSTESIRYPSVGGGTYYIDLSGATNVEGTYHLAVSIATDTEPPRVSLVLDGGAPATNSTTVIATVIVTDDLSAVEAMQLSSDGLTWGVWQAYDPTISWVVSGPDGPKTLWVRVRDGAGNVSAAAEDTIDLDTVPPTVIARSPSPGGIALGLRPTFTVQFSEPISAPTWYNAGFILQAPGGQVVFGTSTYDAATDTGSFTPRDPLIPGGTYVVSLGPITDFAGNVLPQMGSWTVTPMFAPHLTLAASVRVASQGSIVTLAGQIDLWPGGPLYLEASVGADAWTVLQPLIPSADGTWTTSAALASNTTFRVHYGGSQFSAETFSPDVRVLVRRGVAFSGLDPAVTARVRALTRQVLTAVVSPAEPAVPVTFSVYRYVTGRGYVLAASVTRTTMGGRYTFSWTPGRGRYYVRLTTRPTPLFANGISPAYRFVGY